MDCFWDAGLSDANRELLPAVKAVLQGRQFVSARLTGRDSRRATESQVSDGVNEVRTAHALALPRKVDTTLRHAAIVVATEAHRNSLFARLQALGLDMPAAIEQGRYVALDAADALPTFMLRGKPDPVRFLKVLGNLIARAAEAVKGEHARVAIFGEMCHLLWAQGNAEAAIQVEKLGNQLVKTYDVDILCGYSLSSVQGGMESPIYEKICAEHSAVYSR